VPVQRKRLARRPALVAFYVGRDDDRFRDENERLDRELTAAGVPHVFREYAGGHETTLWAAHTPEWLALALSRLAPARPA
jgi:enterochelin esterase-like enzyme